MPGDSRYVARESQPSSRPTTDPLESPSMGGEERELLLGVLALQHRLIDEVSLKAAMEAWRGDPSRSLADHLLSRGAADRGSPQPAGRLLQRHLDRHGGDAARGLAAVTMPRWLEERVP